MKYEHLHGIEKNILKETNKREQRFWLNLSMETQLKSAGD